ncbi:hypothetical protein CHELA1G11_12808 [Hyphomicrobiales bacterium]|nr:hypothetical protein CHELA1G11_12808 [Hyphomicrobiales bacterium]
MQAQRRSQPLLLRVGRDKETLDGADTQPVHAYGGRYCRACCAAPPQPGQPVRPCL